MLLNTVSVTFGFVVSTWYIRSKYFVYMIPQMINVAGTSGPNAAHGAGSGGFVDTNFFLQSIATFWSVERLTCLVIAATILLFIISIVKKKISLISPISLVFFASMAGFLFIFKYQIPYYQALNYFVLVYVGVILLNLLARKWIIITVIVLIPFFLVNLKGHIISLEAAINSSEEISTFQKNHPVRKAALWDYAPVSDFMYIWMRGWGSGIYNDELKTRRPDILELKSDYKTVYFDESTNSEIFNACWDKLYIRDSRAVVFLDMYKDRKFTVTPIGKTGIWEIDSSHCLTRPGTLQKP
jgi:hypothetical protein